MSQRLWSFKSLDTKSFLRCTSEDRISPLATNLNKYRGCESIQLLSSPIMAGFV